MQAVNSFLFSDNDNSTKLTLPPLITSGKPIVYKSVEWLAERATTPPAFLEPQPQTTMDQQHDAIRHPRPHRLSLSSLSSISTESSSEDDQTPQQDSPVNFDRCEMAIPEQQQQQQEQSRNRLSLPSLISSGGNNTRHILGMNQRQLVQNNEESTTSAAASSTDHLPHVATALDHGKHRRFVSLSPRSNNSARHHHHQPSAHQDQPAPLSSTSSTESESSPSPSSPLPSSLMTFWALPTSTNNEQQHEFVTKNSHIKRPRNAWIHFRCYFGQSLKAKDPTIRAEEISKRASEYWSRLTSKQKKPWHVMAEQEKLAHQEAFPDYRYRPKRALPKSVVLSSPVSSPPLACDLDHCSKKFRLA